MIERIRRLVEVDESIYAVFIINQTSQMQNLFIAEDADIDENIARLIWERARKSSIEIDDLLGKSLWKITEFEKLRIIQIYEENRQIVVISKSRIQPGEVTEKVLGYLHESDEPPQSLF